MLDILLRIIIYSLESTYQNFMIYLHVLHILACTDDVPDSHLTSSLVLHILTRSAQSSYSGMFLSESFEKENKIWSGSEKKGTILTPDLLEKVYI